MPSARAQYYREYYNNRVKDNEFYEKEKLRVAEYIKNRKINDPEFVERLREHRRQYRLRKKEEKKALKSKDDADPSGGYGTIPI